MISATNSNNQSTVLSEMNGPRSGVKIKYPTGSNGLLKRLTPSSKEMVPSATTRTLTVKGKAYFQIEKEKYKMVTHTGENEMPFTPEVLERLLLAVSTSPEFTSKERVGMAKLAEIAQKMPPIITAIKDVIAACRSGDTNLAALNTTLSHLIEHVYKKDGKPVELHCLTSEEGVVELLKECDKELDEDSEAVREMARNLAGSQEMEYADTKAAALFVIASMMYYVELGSQEVSVEMAWETLLLPDEGMSLLRCFESQMIASAERIAAGIADDAILDCFTLLAIIGDAQRPLTICAGKPVSEVKEFVVTILVTDTNLIDESKSKLVADNERPSSLRGIKEFFAFVNHMAVALVESGGTGVAGSNGGGGKSPARRNYWIFSHEEDPGFIQQTRWVYKCPCGAQKVERKSINYGVGNREAKCDFETYHCSW